MRTIFNLVIAIQISIFSPSLVQTVQAQQMPFDSLLVANSLYFDEHEHKFAGSGYDFLIDEAKKSQFFCICEEHNLLELNVLGSALFAEFNKNLGYRYLVLEQGVAIGHLYNHADNRGDFQAIADLARSYPQSPTFATDEELKLIADVGRISREAENPVWAIDQDLGALHILERLVQLAPNDSARKYAEDLANLARKHEMDRINGDTLFMSMVATPEMFGDLDKLFKPQAGSEEELLIQAIQRSCRIYQNNKLGRTGQPKLYESAYEREHSMKLQFINNYNIAQQNGDVMPKALVKMGHYHLLRGIYKLNVSTFGNFLSELAIFNGTESFIISSFAIQSPDKWRNSSSLLEQVAGKETYTVVDLRPLRPLANQNKIKDLSDGWKNFIFTSDALLIVRGGRTGNYDIVKSAVQ